MDVKFNNKVRAAVGIVLMLLNSLVTAGVTTDRLCKSSGYTLGFFNGVWNTYSDAMTGLRELYESVPSTYDGRTLYKELFYNHTGCGTAGRTCLEDVAEVFIQRAQELDGTGELSSRIEFFWESVANEDNSLIRRITEIFAQAANVFDALHAEISTRVLAGLAYLLSDPPTLGDYARHKARLNALALEGQMLMLVGHSQGSLFLNKAYDHISPKLGTDSVHAIHVAPASPTLRGSYKLADIDLVINALRVQGPSTVPAVNISLPVSSSDISGHSLIGTYLDLSRPGRAAVVDLLNTSLATLSPSSASTESAGSFTLTLTWSGRGDEDLHIFEPDGRQVYYASKTGGVGYLDTDNTTGYGPEHYFASCDSQVLKTGSYLVGINNFKAADNQTATLQVSTALDGVIFSKQLNTGPTRGPSGNNSPDPALRVVVSKDTTTGDFSFSAE